MGFLFIVVLPELPNVVATCSGVAPFGDISSFATANFLRSSAV